MKKYIIYILILVVGLLFGWLIFGGTPNDTENHNHEEVLKTNTKWTCSMHPQIMQPEPGDCPICGMDLIPVNVQPNGLAVNQFKLSSNAMALANIKTIIVSNNKHDNDVMRLSGKIIENESENAIQASYFSGRIENLKVNFTGKKVHKGQLLATIYSPELYAAQQELLTTAALKQVQPELYKAVRNKLKLWKLSENQINKIEETGKVKHNFPVYATVSGTVTEKLVEQGDYIKQGQPLLKIANLNTVWANFDVYENQIKYFKIGQDVTVTTNAYKNKTFKAKVSFIDPVLNTKTRTVKLRVVLDNKNNFFKPGMFIQAEIKEEYKNNTNLSLPASAILWTGKRVVIYKKMNKEEPVFEMHEIVLGNKIGDTYRVLKGVSIDDEVVVNGTFTVDAAAQLQGKKSMMNKGDGKTMSGHEGHLRMDNNATITNEKLTVSSKFQEQLKVVFNDYINLKDALVEENVKNTSVNATSLLNNLSKVDVKLLSNNNAQTQWMLLVGNIKSSVTFISKTLDIKIQRDHFKHLSLRLINAVQLFGVKQKVYVEFCPMADNNNGAYWLSKEEKVINPYFGEAMITCGEVKKIID